MTLVAEEMEEGHKCVEAAKIWRDPRSQSHESSCCWVVTRLSRIESLLFLATFSRGFFWLKTLLNKDVFIIDLLVMSELHQ